MVPVALAPPLLKAKAAAALETDGVPMAGSQQGRGRRWGRRRHAWHGLAAAGVAAVVTIGLVVALAGRAGDGELGTAEIDATDGTATGADGSTPPTLPARDQSTTTSTTSTTMSTTVEPATDTPAVTTAPPTDPTTTTDSQTTTTDPPAPPTIGGFRASLRRGACEQALPGTAIVWQTSGGGDP
jgi:hypothetical protein